MCSRADDLRRIVTRLRRERDELQPQVRNGRSEIAAGSALDRQTVACVSAGAVSINIERIQKIDEALQRNKQGTFGDCIECRLSIPIERLKADGAAERCVYPCQEDYEKTNPSPMPNGAFGRTTGWVHGNRPKPRDM